MSSSEALVSEVAPVWTGRKLRKVNSNEAVNRLITEHFSTWSAEDIDGVKRDGKTLREALLDERRAANGRNGRVGTRTFADLRKKFAPANSPLSRLVVADRSQMVDVELGAAFELAVSQNTAKRSRVPLTMHLTARESLNQREVVGVFRLCLDVKPGLKPANLSFNLEVMKAVRRMGLDTKFPTECAAMQCHWDEALCIQFSQLAREGISLVDFWQTYSPVCSLVMDHEKAIKVMNAKGSWLPIADSLHNLTMNSKLGMKMFGAAVSKVASEQVQQLIERCLADLTPKPWTEQRVSEVIASILLGSKKIVGAPSLVRARLVRVLYHELPLEVEVTSVEAHARMRIAAEIKTMAWSGQLPQLPFEGILGSAGSERQNDFDKDVIAPFIESRRLLSETLAQETWATGDHLVGIVASRAAALKHVDPSIVLEVELVRAVAGAPGDRAGENVLLSILPTPTEGRTVAEALQAVQKVRGEDWWKCMSGATQGSGAMLEDLLKRMVGGFAPWATGTPGATDFMKKVAAGLPHFVRMSRAQGEKTVNFTGVGAIRMMLAQLIKKSKGEEPVHLKDLEQFVVFRWLLSEKETEVVNGMLFKAMGKQDAGDCGSSSQAGPSAAEGASASSMGGPAAKRPRKSGGKPLVSSASAFFD